MFKKFKLKIDKFKNWYNKKIKENKKIDKNNDEEEKEIIKLDLLSCFFSSILTFVLIIAFLIALIFIANILSNKILDILITK